MTRSRVTLSAPYLLALGLVAAVYLGTAVGISPAPAAAAESAIQLATVMVGSEGEQRDAMESDYVASKKRGAGCRSFTSEGGSTARFANSRLVTARPHAAVHLGPGKHFCIGGFVVGRGLRLEVTSEKPGWFRIKVGKVEGWVAANSVRREM